MQLISFYTPRKHEKTRDFKRSVTTWNGFKIEGEKSYEILRNCIIRNYFQKTYYHFSLTLKFFNLKLTPRQISFSDLHLILFCLPLAWKFLLSSGKKNFFPWSFSLVFFVFIESIEMRQWRPKICLFFTLVLIGMMFSDVQLCKDNPTNFYLFKVNNGNGS